MAESKHATRVEGSHYTAERRNHRLLVDAVPSVLLGRRRNTVNTNDDDDSSMTTTIFSLGSYDISSCDESSSVDSDLDDETGDDLLWEEKWLSLREHYAHRDRSLERMARTVTPAVLDLIRKRELLVRQHERKVLILRHTRSARPHHVKFIFKGGGTTTKDSPFGKGQSREIDLSISVTDSESWDSSSHDEDSSVVWYDAQSISEAVCPVAENPPLHQIPAQEPQRLTFEKPTLLYRLYDILVFEWYTTLPCVACLVIHSLAHASVADGLEIVAEEFKKLCEIKSESFSVPFNHDLISDAIIFGFGLSLLRLSGILYWWMNTESFHCIKFDYHNRLRLKHWDARCLMWVRRHPVVQAMLYFIGYTICFKVVDDLFQKGYHLFDQREDILEGLPSLDEATGLCLAPRTSFRELSCHEEMMRHEERRREIFADDFEYLWKTLYFKSFIAHWDNWAAKMADDPLANSPPPLLVPSQSLFFCLIVATTSVYVLTSYGFAVFSKY